MCCEPAGAEGTPNDVCKDCGCDVVDGISTEICGYSSEECEHCYRAPCDGSC